MADRFRQHFELRLVVWVCGGHLAQLVDQQIGDVMLLFGLVHHEVGAALTAHRRVEDLLFQLRVHLELQHGLLREIPQGVAVVAVREPVEDVFHFVVLLSQQLQRVRHWAGLLPRLQTSGLTTAQYGQPSLAPT
ncbi:MAG TPA: hypothetical protein VFY79_10285 [Dehalococcoidia bacterium]|nr:hypothetical protein [Dehalococcoidia bacterium]